MMRRREAGRHCTWFALILIWTVLSNSVSDGYEMWCSPKLYEGQSWTLHISHTDHGVDVVEGFLTGYVPGVQSTAQFSVDVIGQRYAAWETGQRNGEPYSAFYLYYYAASTLFTVQDGHCQTSPLNSGNVTAKCVEMPDEHVQEYLKEYIGEPEDGTITIGMRRAQNGLGHFYSLDPTDYYIPVMEETHGEINKVPAYTVTNYYNITVGIRDPSVFTPPESCIKQLSTS